MNLAQIAVAVLLTYAGSGLVFALAFVARGAACMDPVVKGTGIGFRVLIVPGSAALWPFLLAKWLRGEGGGGKAP